MPISFKRGRMVTYVDGLLPINFCSSGLVRSCDKLKSLYLPTIVPIVTKLGRMVTYLDELVPIKSYHSLIA